MRRGSVNPLALAEHFAATNAMLNSAQRVIDDAFHMAMLVVSEADGKPTADHAKLVGLARGMLASQSLTALTSYLTEMPLKDGKPTRGGMLRALTGRYD